VVEKEVIYWRKIGEESKFYNGRFYREVLKRKKEGKWSLNKEVKNIER